MTKSYIGSYNDGYLMGRRAWNGPLHEPNPSIEELIKGYDKNRAYDRYIRGYNDGISDAEGYYDINQATSVEIEGNLNNEV